MGFASILDIFGPNLSIVCWKKIIWTKSEWENKNSVIWEIIMTTIETDFEYKCSIQNSVQWYGGRNATTAEDVSRFQCFFPNPKYIFQCIDWMQTTLLFCMTYLNGYVKKSPLRWSMDTQGRMKAWTKSGVVWGASLSHFPRKFFDFVSQEWCIFLHFS